MIEIDPLPAAATQSYAGWLESARKGALEHLSHSRPWIDRLSDWMTTAPLWQAFVVAGAIMSVSAGLILLSSYAADLSALFTALIVELVLLALIIWRSVSEYRRNKEVPAVRFWDEWGCRLVRTALEADLGTTSKSGAPRTLTCKELRYLHKLSLYEARHTYNVLKGMGATVIATAAALKGKDYVEGLTTAAGKGLAIVPVIMVGFAVYAAVSLFGSRVSAREHVEASIDHYA